METTEDAITTTVAVVDDYEDLAVMISRSLELSGFKVRRLPIDPNLFVPRTWVGVDAAVVDLSMPISGQAVLGYLKSNHPEIKRVVCSAMDSLVSEVRKNDAGVVVVRKPMRIADLLAAIQDRGEETNG